MSIYNASGEFSTTEFIAPNSTVVTMSVPSSTTTILGANPLRKGFILFVTGAYPLFIKYGSGAAVNLYSFELAQQVIFPGQGYTGIITAVAPPTLTGSICVTEIY